MRYTEWHAGKAVIKDKNKLSEAIEKLAEFEEKEKYGEWLDTIELVKIAIALQSQKQIPVKPIIDAGHLRHQGELVFSELDVVNMLREQPTSFDVEKVVRELRELKMHYYLTIANTGDADKDCAYLNTANAIDRAIEIVKRGGRDEE